MEDPLETLATVCNSALAQCQGDFVGIQDKELLKDKRMLEQALRRFLQKYKSSKK